MLERLWQTLQENAYIRPMDMSFGLPVAADLTHRNTVGTVRFANLPDEAYEQLNCGLNGVKSGSIHTCNALIGEKY